MPGIIVSRPIFNTLFKLAHEEGLSINAFLTRLLENAGPDAVKQVATGRSATPEPATANPSAASLTGRTGYDATDVPTAPVPSEITGTDRLSGETAGFAGTSRQAVRPIEYDDEPEPAGVGVNAETGERAPGRRIGNSIWDQIVSMEGRRFSTSRGKKFSYKVTGEYIIVRDSSARIPRSQFDKAQKMWPVSGPSRLIGVYAPSVVWAVMKELTEAKEPSLA